jgi:hypothetical protein
LHYRYGIKYKYKYEYDRPQQAADGTRAGVWHISTAHAKANADGNAQSGHAAPAFGQHIKCSTVYIEQQQQHEQIRIRILDKYSHAGTVVAGVVPDEFDASLNPERRCSSRWQESHGVHRIELAVSIRRSATVRRDIHGRVERVSC